MTVSQFRKWLESRIQYLRGLDEFENPDDGPYGHELLEEAYQIAIDLNLPEAAAACRKGPTTVRLLEVLQALPQAELLTMSEAAEYLGYQVSGLRKVVKEKKIRHLQNGKGPIKFKIEWLDEYISENTAAGLANSPARAYRKIEPQFGFDPSLLD